MAARPDGAYSFLYPTDYFHTGSYDESNQRYLFVAAAPSRATYYCTASDNTTTYILKVSYGAVDHQETGVDHTQTGYLLDCLYRG